MNCNICGKEKQALALYHGNIKGNVRYIHSTKKMDCPYRKPSHLDYWWICITHFLIVKVWRTWIKRELKCLLYF